MKDLGNLGGGRGQARAIDSAGRIVGWSNGPDGKPHAFLWTQATGMINLQTLVPWGLGVDVIDATAINDSGQIAAIGVERVDNGMLGATRAVRINVRIYRRRGDLNDDGAVNSGDLAILLTRLGTTDPEADLNSDGVVDQRSVEPSWVAGGGLQWERKGVSLALEARFTQAITSTSENSPNDPRNQLLAVLFVLTL